VSNVDACIVAPCRNFGQIHGAALRAPFSWKRNLPARTTEFRNAGMDDPPLPAGNPLRRPEAQRGISDTR